MPADLSDVKLVAAIALLLAGLWVACWVIEAIDQWRDDRREGVER